MHANNRDAITSLADLLDLIEGVAAEEQTLTVEDILEVVGRRSFGPLLLLAGLVTSMPLVGDLPGMSATMGVFVVSISVQLLMGSEYFWMPRWLLGLDIESDRLQKGLDWMRKPARKLDILLGTRLQALTRGRGLLVVAAVCGVVGLVMPIMEFIPFSATAAGVTLLSYGLALVFNDGLLILLAHLVAGSTLVVVVVSLV